MLWRLGVLPIPHKNEVFTLEPVKLVAAFWSCCFVSFPLCVDNTTDVLKYARSGLSEALAYLSITTIPQRLVSYLVLIHTHFHFTPIPFTYLSYHLSLVYAGPVWSGFLARFGRTGNCNRLPVALRLQQTGPNRKKTTKKPVQTGCNQFFSISVVMNKIQLKLVFLYVKPVVKYTI